MKYTYVKARKKIKQQNSENVREKEIIYEKINFVS